jgi:undecaprenyl-diphosphatase
MGDLWIAVVLGIVEGLTEFLPVSSTGHLIVVGDLLNFNGDKAKCFEIIIQLGAILAVVCLYWHRFIGLIPFRGLKFDDTQGLSGARGLALLFLTSIPAATLGLLAHKAIKAYLFSPVTVAWALGVGGIAMLLAERYKPESNVRALDGISYRQALLVGCFQCFALWPGMSRSASTIIGGLFVGLDRRTATEYSFLAAVPIMIAATCFDLLKNWSLFQASDFTFIAIGFVVSFVSAAAAVKGFIALVQRWSLAPYAWYRIAIAPIIYFVMKT